MPTCLMCDIDRSAGCGAISSPSYSINSDDVVSTRLQIVDCGGGLRARHCELLGITVTSWIKDGINVKQMFLSAISKYNMYTINQNRMN